MIFIDQKLVEKEEVDSLDIESKDIISPESLIQPEPKLSHGLHWSRPSAFVILLSRLLPP